MKQCISILAISLAAFALLFTPSNSHATPNIKVTKQYRKVQVFDMTGMDIKGGLTAPLLTEINATVIGPGKNLIKIRKHWKQKIKNSVESL